MSRFSIRYPYLIIVVCLIVCVVGGMSVVRMPVDLFPAIRIPVVVVATFFNGMPPEQIENDITLRQERFFTLASGIDHMESRSLPGVSLIKIYFQPGMSADAAVSTISNLAAAEMRRLPPGTLPPVVLKFDASSLPVCLITLKGEGMNETELRDIGHYVIRNQVAGVSGASVPSPYGGKYRQIMVYVDPVKLEAHQLSAMDVVRSVNESNLILPSGDVRIGPYDFNLYANTQVDTMDQINRIPLKTVDGTSVLVGDVGRAVDGAQIQTNLVRVDGQRSAYLPVLKQGGDVNTIAVVDGVKAKVADLVDVPKQLIANVVFDQSVFVKTAIENLLHEGAIGLVLTGIMILVFLGNFRATVAVFLSIPLSALATFIGLSYGDSSVNSMILGGLALAFSRLIDNSVVVLENIFRHIELGEKPEVAAEKGGREVALPVLAATLTTAIVFFPVTFLSGVSRFLFTALALSVVLSLFASYVVAMTVVPLFCAKLIKGHGVHGDAHGAPRTLMGRFNAWFNVRFHAFLGHFDRAQVLALGRPLATVLGIGGVFLLSLCLIPKLGLAYFPRTDPGQFVINVKAPTGTHLDGTDKFVAQVEDIIRKEVPPDELDLIVSNIGLTPDLSAMTTSNSGQHTAFIQANLKEGHRVSSFDYMERVRRRVHDELPIVDAYFQSGGLVDAVLNLGLPAPIDIQISGKNLNEMHDIAVEIARKVRATKGVGDVLIPQDVDYPTLRLEIDRERAAELGLSQKEIMQNVITALTSNGMIAPSFWADPKSGNDYLLTVQYKETQVKDINDLLAIPLRGAGMAEPTRLDAVCRIKRERSPTEIDHYQLRKVIDVYVAPETEDLGTVFSAVKKIVADTKKPENVRIAIQGSVKGMESSFTSFGYGLILSVVLVYLILVAQFKSFIDPFLIMLAVPPGIAGALLILTLTGTTMNIMSLMGIVMMVGIVVSNSILIVEFTHRLIEDGLPLREAVQTATRVRLRPILMTSLATIFGLIPMALKLGAGSEAYAPLARVIIGGLLASLLMTVFIVPAAFLIVYRRRAASAGIQPPGSHPRPAVPAHAVVAILCALLLWTPCAQAAGKKSAKHVEKHTENPEPIDRLDLKTAETIALRRAPEIAAAYLKARAANEVTKQARANFFPQLSGAISLVGSGDDISRTFGGSPLTGKTTTIGASGGLNTQTVLSRESNGVLFSQLVTDFGRTGFLTTAAKLDALSEQQRAELVRQNVVLLVDQAFFHALEAGALLRVARETISSRQLIADRTTALVQAKLKSELDASLARVSVEQARLLQLQADNKLRAAHAELSAALGYRELHHFTLVEEQMPVWREQPLETLLTAALQNRPEVNATRLHRDASRKLAAAEQAARLPKITLQGAFGRTAAGDVTARETYAAAGFNVEIPLLAGGRLKAKAAEAGLRSEADQKTLESVEDRVSSDVTLAWLGVRAALRTIEVTESLRTSAREAYELARARYEAGVASIVEFSQAELGKTDAEIQHVNAIYEYQIQRALLSFQTGTITPAAPPPASLYHRQPLHLPPPAK
ncbi:MAG: efflux RND transporter permease subunit [Chthoniobacteraceae bacterium]